MPVPDTDALTPTTPDEVGDMRDCLVATAKHYLERDGELNPPTVAAIIKPRRRYSLVALNFTPDTKRAAFAALHTKLHDYGADALVLVSDAWFAEPEPGEKITAPVSEHPKRRECLHVVCFAAGWQEARAYPYHRDAQNNITWDEPTPPTADFSAPVLFNPDA